MMVFATIEHSDPLLSAAFRMRERTSGHHIITQPVVALAAYLLFDLATLFVNRDIDNNFYLY